MSEPIDIIFLHLIFVQRLQKEKHFPGLFVGFVLTKFELIIFWALLLDKIAIKKKKNISVTPENSCF